MGRVLRPADRDRSGRLRSAPPLRAAGPQGGRAVPARGDDPPEPPAWPARGGAPPEPPAWPARGGDPPEPPHGLAGRASVVLDLACGSGAIGAAIATLAADVELHA